MSDPWEILCAGGVPDGAVRPPPRPPLDVKRLAGALRTLLANLPDLPSRRRDPLLAWLCAFQKHWPSEFDRVLGADGSIAIGDLEALGCDPNRYLKLRRIAIENLSGVL